MKKEKKTFKATFISIQNLINEIFFKCQVKVLLRVILLPYFFLVNKYYLR
jgi:hypothetical protein